MLDIRFIRENAEAVQANARNKACDVDITTLLKLDTDCRVLQGQVDELRQKRNDNVEKSKGGRPTPELIAEGKVIKDQLAEIEPKLKEVSAEFLGLLKKVPNMAWPDVPVGHSEEENVVVKTVGDVPKFDFIPLNHAAIAAKRDWLDKERASKVAGSRFAYVKGDMVRLQFAIINFVMDLLGDETKIAEIAKNNKLDVSTKPFVPVLPPYMIRTEVYDAMDRLEPRDERYKLENDDLWLQGSAEHTLGSMYVNEVLDESQLPIRYLGYATSFRREAGTYGKDMEGLFRMHQFDKLEIESFTTAENGLNEHLLFAAIQDYMLTQLELPHQIVQKCTFDIGKPNARGVDMNTYLPGQGKYRETHTADYMTDYQSRRMNTRVRRKSGALELVHTNDATAFALGRIMIAILENNQTADGQVKVPTALQNYLGGRTIL
ncbi:MAG: serine--tRNA ligase [Candidatus Saccharibacteria bacterium]